MSKIPHSDVQNVPLHASHSQTLQHATHVHFVGIGGAGMGGIAELLLCRGYRVSGSDQVPNHITRRLSELGAVVYDDHRASHITNANILVQSSAISTHNPEIIAAKEAGIPIVHRATMLADMARLHYGIAITGTHGKTTTTALLAHILLAGACDPTCVVGGTMVDWRSNACCGQGPYFVMEADESDASFLAIKPIIAVVTNIDQDHMVTYQHDAQCLQQAFIEFAQSLPFYGLLVACYDDPNVRALLPYVRCPVLTYGMQEGADIRAMHYRQEGIIATCSVQRKHGDTPLALRLPMPGQHNVNNALAAIAVATHLNIADDVMIQALAQFRGIGRRFQFYENIEFQHGRAHVIDDYGHHPAEITATLQAIRAAFPKQRLVLVFQPHRYSRTRDLFDDFVHVLGQVDVLMLMTIYAAGEAAISGIDRSSLSAAIADRHPNMPQHVPTDASLLSILQAEVREGDVVLMQGAGSIGDRVQDLLKALEPCV